MPLRKNYHPIVVKYNRKQMKDYGGFLLQTGFFYGWIDNYDPKLRPQQCAKTLFTWNGVFKYKNQDHELPYIRVYVNTHLKEWESIIINPRRSEVERLIFNACVNNMPKPHRMEHKEYTQPDPQYVRTLKREKRRILFEQFGRELEEQQFAQARANGYEPSVFKPLKKDKGKCRTRRIHVQDRSLERDLENALSLPNDYSIR